MNSVHSKYPEPLNSEGYDSLVDSCTPSVRELLLYLRQSAQHAGAEVYLRRYRPRTGSGETFYAKGTWFCQFHPKPHADHVMALLKGIDARELASVGLTPTEDRADGQLWFRLSSMHEAVRTVPLILRAFDGL